ncbi:hypothetical protein NIES23_64260 (plasmid) [Trichormus variabilis NIES-23]|uniref:Uncharacterized protein n=1 Tax=Trichormus variabilis NIES-23 TaxID=1973479 RepID=A0A1Z4KX55_ANAVA|nr:hypothetical protein NIES23_64260 [Trichormus variabilis NIES-23]
MTTATIPKVSEEFKQLLSDALIALNKLKAHEDFQPISKSYNPDFSLSDAQFALLEIGWEITDLEKIGHGAR